MSGLLGHISAEDRDWLEQEKYFDNHGIGPLGGHMDDGSEWSSIALNLSDRNHRLEKENKQLRKEIQLLKKKLKK